MVIVKKVMAPSLDNPTPFPLQPQKSSPRQLSWMFDSTGRNRFIPATECIRKKRLSKTPLDFENGLGTDRVQTFCTMRVKKYLPDSVKVASLAGIYSQDPSSVVGTLSQSSASVSVETTAVGPIPSWEPSFLSDQSVATPSGWFSVVGDEGQLTAGVGSLSILSSAWISLRTKGSVCSC